MTAADLALFSQQKPSHRDPISTATAATTTTSMWNPKQPPQVEEDDSWEVRAFAEDTGNIMGTTWPPRSYTCAFCRREFRSAQALGGHMNVHRRDRARLHQTHHCHQPDNPATATSSSSSTLILQGQEFAANGAGLCILYQLPNPNGVVFPSPNMIDSHSPSSFFGIEPSSANFPATFPGILNPNYPSFHYTSRAEFEAASTSNDELIENNNISEEAGGKDMEEEVDLELRLGQRPSPP